ncbi:MAG: protein translocase subunit SecD [Legionellaceae bacterium]|nr:protein translocase subunit SecD [Legionellaceae bacterium]
MQNTYPRWKNGLLIFIVLIAVIYAIPNLYTEYPAIEISSTITPQMSVEKQVAQALKDAHIAYYNIAHQGPKTEVRFKSTDTQLLAQDVLKKTLGSDFTVALNLAPATPRWLSNIGAHPMKQGLDLRGGVHFLLEVDVDNVINKRYEGLMKNIGQNMRKSHIRYSGMRYLKNQGIIVYLRDKSQIEQAVALIKQDPQAISIKTDKDKSRLTLEFDVAELTRISQTTIEQTMSILRNRVNELGVGEAVVQQQGATRIAVDLPGIQDATRAQQILGGTATLQFYLVDQAHDVQTVKQTGMVPMGSKLYTLDGYPILLKRQMVLSGNAITSAISSFDEQSASPAVQIQLGGGGEALFTKITRNNIGKRMAIVYVETKHTSQTINGQSKKNVTRQERVISAPVIQSALGNNFQITGLKDRKEAADLALLLRAGALPAAIYPVEERTVGPSLGKENIERGLISLAVGMGLIVVLMLVYYRFFGLVANIALLLNLILLSAVLSLIGTTLTLPGIAGFVLTVGMAVDANVLIYERIREELRIGMSPQSAIFAGYDRAFSTIMDANVTTLIVGIVLFAIGTGPIRGFAIILSLGLMTSMLTSITYTRAIVNWYYGRKAVKSLSIGI